MNTACRNSACQNSANLPGLTICQVYEMGSVIDWSVKFQFTLFCYCSLTFNSSDSLLKLGQWSLLVRPKTIVFGRTYVLRVMFFFVLAKSPRCVGRLA